MSRGIVSNIHATAHHHQATDPLVCGIERFSATVSSQLHSSSISNDRLVHADKGHALSQLALHQCILSFEKSGQHTAVEFREAAGLPDV